MRLSLGPRQNEFYELLARSAEIALEVARKAETRFREYPNASVDQEEIKRLEHVGDDITTELIGHLNTQHITPFDRDDIFILAGAIDDVTDAIENACELLGLYGIEAPTKYSLEQCRLLVAATEHLVQLLRELRRRRGSELIGEIKRLEDEADRVKRDAVASLFKDERIDPLIVVRWKDVYEALEDAIDACETVAHLVGNLLVKHH